MNSKLSEGSSVGDYQVVRKLAEGGMGEVFLVQTSLAQDLLVLKSVLCGSMSDAKEALKEAAVLKDIQHPNVVAYIDVFPYDENNSGVISVCTVMEYCSRGDLAQHLGNVKQRQRNGLSQGVVIAWAMQLLAALDRLHNLRVLHRDLKPHNVFMTSQGNLKIGDFGLATSLARTKVTSRVGTPSYIAPEVLQHDGYGPAVDIWGVGCLAFEMMTLDFLFERDGMLAMQVHTKPLRASIFSEEYSVKLRELIVQMLLVSPSQRPSAQGALQILEDLSKQGARGPYGNSYSSYMLLQEQAAIAAGASLAPQKQSASMSRKTPSRMADVPSMPKAPEPDVGEAKGGEDIVANLMQGLKQVDVFGVFGGFGGTEAHRSQHGEAVASGQESSVPPAPASSVVRNAFDMALSEEDVQISEQLSSAGEAGTPAQRPNVLPSEPKQGVRWNEEELQTSFKPRQPQPQKTKVTMGQDLDDDQFSVSSGNEDRRVARFAAKKKEPVPMMAWDAVLGKDASAPEAPPPQPEVPSARKGASSILREPRAFRHDGKSNEQVKGEERKRQALEAARNPGRGAGQWIMGEKGTMEWVSTSQLETKTKQMEEEAEKDRVLRERASANRVQMPAPAAVPNANNPNRPDLAARAKVQMEAAPIRATWGASIESRGQLDESESNKKKGFMGRMSSFGKKQSGSFGKKGRPQAATEGLDPWGNPITSPANVPWANQGGAGYSMAAHTTPSAVSEDGRAERVGNEIFRVVYHGPLKYRLSFDMMKWEQARAQCEKEKMKDYVDDLPPALRADPNMIEKQLVKVDDDAIDKRYRSMFGPPASKQVH